MGYTLARQKAYCNAQPMSHETFLLPSSGELGNRFDRAPTSVFPASQIFLVFLFQKSVPSQSLRTCRRLQNRRYFFGVLQASAKRKKKNCARFTGYHHYKPEILNVNGRTAKTSSWEPLHGSCSILKLLR